MLLSKTCAGCRRAVTNRWGHGAPFCVSCHEGARPVGAIAGFDGLDAAGALYPYGGGVRRAIVAAKTGARPDVLRHFGVELAALARLLEPRAGTPSAVTWVPASRAGLAERGYDQSRLLARTVADTLGVPSRRMLARSGTGSQIGRDRSQRLVGPGLRSRGSICGRILLVDDVVTTGASLRCAADELRSAGADVVVGVCVAWAASADEIARSRPMSFGGDLGRSSSASGGLSG